MPTLNHLPGIPRFLYGHSLGAILVISYVLSCQQSFTGVICTYLALHYALENQPLKIVLVKTLGRFFPHWIISSGLDPQGQSSDKEGVRAYIDDPLVHNRGSLVSCAEMIRRSVAAWQKSQQFPIQAFIDAWSE